MTIKIITITSVIMVIVYIILGIITIERPSINRVVLFSTFFFLFMIFLCIIFYKPKENKYEILDEDILVARLMFERHEHVETLKDSPDLIVYREEDVIDILTQLGISKPNWDKYYEYTKSRSESLSF